MHLFESWHNKPKIHVDIEHKNTFDLAVKKESNYSILVVADAEVNLSETPFIHAQSIFGETKHSLLYPAQSNGKKMFLSLPTQSEPKKLSSEQCGKAHLASHFGACLAQAILALPLVHGTKADFYVALSNRVTTLIEGEESEFLLGILQRAISSKMKNSGALSKQATAGLTLIFCTDVFSKTALHKAHILSNAMSMTRALINMPANVLSPQGYEDCVRFLVDSQFNRENDANSVQLEVIGYEQLKNLGCGLICAVGQGSEIKPRILKLSYHPTEPSTKHVVLVGKGVTFDSGGYDLKPPSGMRNMKKDMGGSASALGVFFACAHLKLPIRLTCYLAVAENMISGEAMRPGDVYKAYNGLHVEIDNTDAEGRLVLADALSLAVEDQPSWIVNLATLTGAARTALGPLVDCAYGNRTSLNALLNAMSLETGDWVWNLPLPAQYESYFDSSVANIMNSTSTPFAGSITAALFLQKFVGDCAWNHIDTFMWCDKAHGLWGESNAPTAKCVRLLVRTLEHCSSEQFILPQK